jgi:bacterioferritin
MPINKKTLIKELNKDLEWEYASAVQYIQHATMITGAQFQSIQKELIIHSQEEMQHAVMVAEQIEFLGGVPTVEVEKRQIAKNSLVMLKQDLEGEDIAIQRYKERIVQADKLGEFGLRRVLEDILLQEEEHKRDLLGVIED